MSKDYNEIWLESMSLLIDHRLQGLEYDKTVKCQVIADKGNGTYLVQENDSIKYDAISTEIEYKVDEWVYVTIPNGDYNQTKIIISKYTENPNNNPINYIPPLGTFVPMTENLVEGVIESSSVFSILANGSDLDSNLVNPGESLVLKKLAEIDLTDNKLSENIRYNEIYDTIGLSADFKTLFNDLDMQSGNYGLRLFFIEDGQNPTIADFDNSEMFGDPYAYNFYLTQSKKFNISTLGNIDKIIIILYQKDNFKHYNENGEVVKVSPQYTLFDKLTRKPDNILVQNIKIQFGKDISTIPDNTFELTVSGPETTRMKYKKDGPAEYSNGKTIYATWYNKTEDNEFIGFSDGIVDKAYDEDAYMQLYESQMAGASLGAVSGIPRLKESLQIYANAQNIEKEFQSIHTRVGQNIKDVLTNLYSFIRANGLLDDRDPTSGTTVNNKIRDIATFNNSGEISGGLIQDYINTIIKDCENVGGQDQESFLDVYDKFLKFSNECVEALKNKTSSNLPNTTEITGLNNRFNSNKNQWNSLKTNINSLYTFLKQISVETNYHGDVRAYVDRSTSQMLQYIAYVDASLASILELITSNRTQVDSFMARLRATDLTSFEEEYDIFQKNNANKYCIYWYRSSSDAPGDRWVSPGWERILFNPISSTPGLPKVVDNKYEKRSNNSYKDITMNYDVEKDCFKAVLFFNHVAYWSNELEFINLDPPMDTQGSDLKGALHIELSDNASDSYQKYGSSLSLLNISDSMINRELLITYENADASEGDEVLAGCWIYWYIPLNATMLKTDDSRLTREGFSLLSDYKGNSLFTDIYKKYEKVDEYGNPTHKCYFKQIGTIEEGSGDNKIISPDPKDITFYHLIKPVFNPAYTQNEIICIVNRNGIDYMTSRVFTFSTFGTSGTDFTLSIAPTTTQYAVEYIDNTSNRALPLRASFSGYDGKTVENPPAITAKWWGISVPSGQINQINELPNQGSVDYEIMFDTTIGATLPESDPARYCLYRVLECNADWNQLTEEIEADQTLILRSYYPIATSYGMYYMTGPTTIIYDDAGNNPVYSNEAYKLFNRTTNTQIPNLRWEVIHYEIKNGQPSLVTDESLLRYLPTIGTYNNNGVTEYKLKPLTMYVQDLKAYSVVLARDPSLGYIFAQPLFISQNRYGCPMINTWDEKLNIDEENNTILAAMMGAGYKDEENRFYGVLMGNVGEKTKNETMKVGIYGINEGYQSFGLTVDGKAFFGKSGRGQIKLDGNTSTIKSASYDINGGSGMLIDLDDGFIDMKGTVEYTQTDFESLSEKEKRNQSTYNDYQERFGSLYKTDGTSSHIRLDVKSPYFQITSANDHKILHIANDAYYLESDNYVPGVYNWTDRQGHSQLGTGTRFDLQSGMLDAYNLKIQSKNILLDSSENANPYFIVKDDDGCNLIHAGTNDYYFQTCQYVQRVVGSNDTTLTPGKGMKIDLKNNLIDAYDFHIRGESSSGDKTGSYLLLDSGTPQLAVHLIDSAYERNIDLLRISPTEFVMHSANWGKSSTTGTIKTETWATVVCSYLAVRTYPDGFNGSTLRYNPRGTTFRVYGWKEDPNYPGHRWWSLSESMSVGQSDSAWSAETYVNEPEPLLSITEGGETEVEILAVSGAEIDMGNGGKLTFSKGINALFIDANHNTYPIQLGKQDGNAELKFGWDGSIYGGIKQGVSGVTTSWYILSDGTASFKKLITSTGTTVSMQTAEIKTGQIGGCQVTDQGILCGDWLLSSSGISSSGESISFQEHLGVIGLTGTKKKVKVTNSEIEITGTCEIQIDEFTTYAGTCKITLPSLDLETSEDVVTALSERVQNIKYCGLIPDRAGTSQVEWT